MARKGLRLAQSSASPHNISFAQNWW